MKITNLKKLKPKSLIVFDLDGTLAPTKAPMDKEVTSLLVKLLKTRKVAVIGGGKYELFKLQLLEPLKEYKRWFKNLFLFPTTATSFYRYEKGWKNIYSLKLSKAERDKITKTFERVFRELKYSHPKKTYGKIIEDRGTQITFSALGQDAVKILGTKGIALKEQWKRENNSVKIKIGKLMQKYLPEFEIRVAGYTSVDVTRKGIDKAYGLKQIQKYLKIHINDMIFIGDAIFPGGNDYAVTKTGIDYVPVSGPEETKKVISAILNKPKF